MPLTKAKPFGKAPSKSLEADPRVFHDIAWGHLGFDYPVRVPFRTRAGGVETRIIPFGILIREYMAEFVSFEDDEEV